MSLRFSLRHLVAAIALLSLALAAMQIPSPIVGELAFGLNMILLALGIAGALLRTHRPAFWTGVAVFGCGYALLASPREMASTHPWYTVWNYRSGAPQGRTLLTDRLLQWYGSFTHRSPAVGDAVMAQWQGGGYWPAKITQYNADSGLYLVTWDDGSAPSHLSASQIQGYSGDRERGHALLGMLIALAGGVAVNSIFGPRHGTIAVPSSTASSLKS